MVAPEEYEAPGSQAIEAYMLSRAKGAEVWNFKGNKDISQEDEK